MGNFNTHRIFKDIKKLLLSVIRDDGIVTTSRNVYLLEIYAKLFLEKMSSPESITDVGSSELPLIFFRSLGPFHFEDSTHDLLFSMLRNGLLFY